MRQEFRLSRYPNGIAYIQLRQDAAANLRYLHRGVRLENGIYGHSRFCNTDFDDKLACLNLSGV
ncbi:hypothetical protein FV280_20000 [Escherichia coli]|nr:hypothetical protein FV280_20000 [Escherichia coli]